MVAGKGGTWRREEPRSKGEHREVRRGSSEIEVDAGTCHMTAGGWVGFPLPPSGLTRAAADALLGGDSAAPGQQQAAVLLAHGKLAEQSSNSLPSLEGKNVEQDPQSAAEEGRTGGGGLHFSGSSPALLNAASDPPKPAANEGGGVEARAKDAMERRKAGVTLS